MKEWLDLDPVNGWTAVREETNVVSFEHPDSNERLAVIRLRGPTHNTMPCSEAYTLRLIHEDDESWEDLVTTEELGEIKDHCRQTMAELPGAEQPSVLGE